MNINKQMDPSYKPGIDMSSMTDYLHFRTFVPREDALQKQVLFCLTVALDTTGSMRSAIESAKSKIQQIFDNLKKIQRENNVKEGGIVGQIVQYKDYHDRCNADNNCSITSDINELERRLHSFDADGGSDCGCEDMHYAIECALNNMEKSPYKDYAHLLLIVGDINCHGDYDGCSCSERIHPDFGIPITEVWPRYFRRMKNFNNLQISFIPIRNNRLTYTFNRFKSDSGLNVTCENNTSGDMLSEIIESISETHYRKLIGISKNRRY